MSKTFLEGMSFVAAGVRKLPAPSWGWRKTLTRGGTQVPWERLVRVGSGRASQASGGQGTQVCPCLCRSLPFPLGVLRKLCGLAAIKLQ